MTSKKLVAGDACIFLRFRALSPLLTHTTLPFDLLFMETITYGHLNHGLIMCQHHTFSFQFGILYVHEQVMLYTY